MKRISFAVLALVLSFGNLSSLCAEPIWPLDIEISQSSSFAEFRGMRFHAGLDLRTKQTNGFPVYAIEDGFISRASVQFTGYGYGLYIDHPKLNARVVYGHLKCFNGPIQDYIAGKLKAKGARHGINEFFKADRFPVKKGQLVAYSGESGAGPSHLHFEMRRFNDDPIAPAKFGFRPKDNIYPNVYHFYAEPMEYAAVIDGSFKGKKYNLTKKTKELYYVSGSPVCFGNVGFQLGIADTNGSGNKYGVENISLSINGKKLIQRDFYQYSYDANRQCPFVYDYFKSNMTGTGYVINLFKYPFETLPFAASYPAWSGVVGNNTYSGAKASFEIQATDFGNNKLKVVGGLEKTSYDFSTTFASAELNDYLLYEITTNMFGTIIICKNSKFDAKVANNKDLVVRSGNALVKDAYGNMHSVPCLKSGKFLELALKNEPSWQGGAWLGNVQILPKTFWIDPKGCVIREGAIQVEFKKNTVHEPILAMLRNVNNNPAPGGNNKDGFMKPYSAVWRFDPDNIVFDTEAVVNIQPNAYAGDLVKLGVYSVSNTGKYSHNGEEINNGRLQFTARAGGRYVILEDLIPPALSYARRFVHYQLGNVYAFKASDIGEGVAWLSGSATINGTKVETYADPDKKEIYVLIPANIKMPHKIKLTVKDNAGNSGTINSSIAK